MIFAHKVEPEEEAELFNVEKEQNQLLIEDKDSNSALSQLK